VIEGEVTLMTDEGPQKLRAGDCMGFRAGVENGHHLMNESASRAVILEVGSRDERDEGRYSDVDLVVTQRYAAPVYTKKDGSTF